MIFNLFWKLWEVIWNPLSLNTTIWKYVNEFQLKEKGTKCNYTSLPKSYSCEGTTLNNV